MTCPPAASIRAAAAITSITMKGGTSLRRDGVNRVFTRSLSVASRIDFCYLVATTDFRFPNRLRPRLAAFQGLLFMTCYSVFPRSDTGSDQENAL